jgi:diacylglycerol kinase (ATP)
MTVTTTHGRFRTAIAIVNPTAGTMSANVLAELVARCGPLIGHLRVHRTTEPGDATRAAARTATDQVDVVIAVGGDGTVREVVQGLLEVAAELRPTLLVVPAGTGNSNYLAHWGNLPWPDAVTSALSGRDSSVHLLDLAHLVEVDALVLLGACSGLIAEALVTARSVPQVGRERYRIALATTAERFKPYPGRVTVDGVVVHAGPTVLANVGGGRYRGGTYQVLPHSMLDDGLLDVCVIGSELAPVKVPELTRTGAHLRHPGVVYARGREVSVERTDGRPITFEHDGELRTGSTTRTTMRVLPNALRVLCQAGSELFGAPADRSNRTAKPRALAGENSPGPGSR